MLEAIVAIAVNVVSILIGTYIYDRWFKQQKIFPTAPEKSESSTDQAKRRPRAVPQATRGFSSLCYLCLKRFSQLSIKTLKFQQKSISLSNFGRVENKNFCGIILFVLLPLLLQQSRSCKGGDSMDIIISLVVGVISSIAGSYIYNKFFKKRQTAYIADSNLIEILLDLVDVQSPRVTSYLHLGAFRCRILYGHFNFVSQVNFSKKLFLCQMFVHFHQRRHYLRLANIFIKAVRRHYRQIILTVRVT